MARTVTLGSLKTQALQRADMVNSTFIDTSGTTSELNGYINASAAELYDLLVAAYEDHYLSSSTFSLVSGTDSYALPSDFYKLRGLDLIDASGNTLTLEPFQFRERNNYLQPMWNAVGLDRYRYHLQGSQVRFVPPPNGAATVKFWYTPAIPLLVNDSDTFDGFNGWEEYIVIDAAIKMLQKEESDASLLMAQKAAIGKRIQDMAANRDAGAPGRVSDVTRRPRLAYGDYADYGDGY